MSAAVRSSPEPGFFQWYYGLFNDTDALENAIRELGSDTIGAGDQAGTLDFIDNPLVAHSLLQELDLDEGDDVIDVGCGLGGPARLFAGAGARVTAVDVNPDQVAACLRLNELTGAKRVDVVLGDAQNLPLPSDRFSAYVSIGALCHTYDRSAALREALRVLRPGGSLAVVDINAGPEDGHEWFGDRFWHLISNDEYQTVARDSGFEDVSVQDLRLDYAEQIDIYVEVMERARDVFEKRFGSAERFAAALETYRQLVNGLQAGTLGACWLRATRPGRT